LAREFIFMIENDSVRVLRGRAEDHKIRAFERIVERGKIFLDRLALE